MLFEWDYRPRGYNLLNTLTRRVETYHEKLLQAVEANPSSGGSASIHELVLTKEKGLDQKLHYDRWPRTALLDHFPGWNSIIEEFGNSRLADYGTFLRSPYQIEEMYTDGVKLVCRGHVGETALELSKAVRVVPGKSVLSIQYRIVNVSQFKLDSPFGVEWNLALKAGNSPQHHISIPETGDWNRPLGEIGDHRNVQEIRLADEHEGVAVRFSFDGTTRVWRVPIESVSLSEGGFERVFQSIALMFLWELHLAPGQVWERRITAELSQA